MRPRTTQLVLVVAALLVAVLLRPCPLAFEVVYDNLKVDLIFQDLS